MPVAIRITTKGFRAVSGRFAKVAEGGLRQIARKAMQNLMRGVRDEVRSEAPTNLRRYVSYRTDISTKTPQGMEGRIELKQPPDPPYPPRIWDYIIEGTDPHIIEASNRRALHFYWEKVGSEVFFKYVRHPGTDPNDFPARAFRRVGRQYMESMARKVSMQAVAMLEGR